MRFLTDFPSGNGKLLRAEETKSGFDITFLAENRRNEPQPLWFYFRLEGLRGERIRLCLANSAQCLGGALEWSDNRPVYRFDGQPWRRIDKVENSYNRMHTLDTWFEVPCQGANMEFAFCYPYPMSQMLETANVCPVFEQTIIGYSNHAKPIYRFASDLNALQKTGVYIIGRQHASEVTGAWEIDGMMRYLASPAGEKARNALAWWFVPIVDIDGVEEGIYGKDQIGGDLNRGWSTCFPKRTELVAVEHDMQMWMKYTNAHLMLDMHSPGHGEHESYFVIHAEMGSKEREELRAVNHVLNRRLAAHGLQDILIYEYKAGSNTSSQAGMRGSDYIQAMGYNGCSFECTYQGERDKNRFYTIEDYQTLGASMVESIYEVLTAEKL